MNNLLKEILTLFVVVVLSNVLVELGEEEKKFLVKPVRFFGGAIILSIIGGFFMNWMKNRKK